MGLPENVSGDHFFPSQVSTSSGADSRPSAEVDETEQQRSLDLAARSSRDCVVSSDVDAGRRCIQTFSAQPDSVVRPPGSPGELSELTDLPSEFSSPAPNPTPIVPIPVVPDANSIADGQIFKSLVGQISGAPVTMDQFERRNRVWMDFIEISRPQGYTKVVGRGPVTHPSFRNTRRAISEVCTNPCGQYSLTHGVHSLLAYQSRTCCCTAVRCHRSEETVIRLSGCTTLLTPTLRLSSIPPTSTKSVYLS